MPYDLPSLREAYLENVDYDQVGSKLKAWAFVHACRRLMLMLPKEGHTGGAGGELFSLDTRQVQEEMRRAERWLAARNVKPKYFDVSGFRE